MRRCVRDSVVIVQIMLLLSLGAEAATNNTMPSLLLPDLNGRLHTPSDWPGKVILLNFWASWCNLCQVELPHLIGYQHRYAKQDLQVIGIGLDDPKKLANVARTLKIPYPVLYHRGEQGGLELLRQWGNSAGVLPFTVVIDRDGSIVSRHLGVFDEETFNLIVLPLLESH